MTKYVSGIVQRASPNVGAGRIRPAGRSLGTPDLEAFNFFEVCSTFYFFNSVVLSKTPNQNPKIFKGFVGVFNLNYGMECG